MPIVKIEDQEEAAAYGLKTLPALVLFDNGIPERYPGFDLTKSPEIKQWIMDEILYDDIDVIEVGETLKERRKEWKLLKKASINDVRTRRGRGIQEKQTK